MKTFNLFIIAPAMLLLCSCSHIAGNWGGNNIAGAGKTTQRQSSLKNSATNSTNIAPQSITEKASNKPIFASASDERKFLESGTVILSMRIPEKQAAANPQVEERELGKPSPLAPLIGYFPPAVSYVPAENETWLEISKAQQKLTLYKGNTVVKTMNIEGSVSLNAGDYFLQHKQKNPLWYAPNEYFAKRQLRVPSEDDRLRYRRGALGRFALFPTNTFPIHSAPVWTAEVGGLRVSETDLHSIFLLVPVGSPVVVK